jgi:hypothetical protein
MRRRELLAAVGVSGVVATSGCLGHSTDNEGELTIDRPGQDIGGGCKEIELLDVERLRFPPAYFRLLGIENAVQWELDLKEDEEIYIRITSSETLYLPLFKLTDPDGNVLYDDDEPSQNIHRFTADRDGIYTIWIGDRRTEGGEWFVDLAWYNDVGCSDPYSR